MEQWGSLFTNELKARWDEYVDCQKRIILEGPFLLSVLQSHRGGLILDAALGLGCEARFLVKNGFRVVANEIDGRLAQYARVKLAQDGLDVLITRCDWRDLADKFPEESFDAVIIVGNSICLLPNALDRTQVFENVFKLLKTGGVFVVDQRNFDYFFAERAAIIRGEMRYSGNIMYCERGIIGRPTIIESERVRLTCYDKKERRQLGYFDLYPFKADELKQALGSAGFSRIDEYYDFSCVLSANWDFRTYVCTK